MHIPTGRSKLLALLFFFLSHLTLALRSGSNFHTQYTHPPFKNPLSKRAYPDYAQLDRDIDAAVSVSQNEQKYVAFGSESSSIGSRSFTGCLEMVIASTKGAIVGHWEANNGGIQRAKNTILSLIDDNKDALAVAGVQAWLYVHVRLRNPDVVVAEPLVQELEALAQDGLGIEAAMVKYMDPSDLLEDENGDIRDDIDDFSSDLVYGSILVQHPGGQGRSATVMFAHLDWQKSVAPLVYVGAYAEDIAVLMSDRVWRSTC